ncbi:MIP/aquaporin family protein [Nitrosomonas oligotropha]|uniref:MIP/aquaporin family protein n=1 Tax=Nitrosomonas oligotropha TaxID=42354 RepID=UPI0013706468|nr:aquaporin [Nitrosomonas oligotropha]MXS83919.1 porin [Nitrosomonas oligotropha]
MNKFIVECIGTFFLLLTIGLTVIPGSAGVIAPLAIGSVLMVLVYAGGHISGAHYNPAVTLAVLIRGKCTIADVPVYFTAQILGAVAGALTAQFLVGSGTAAGTIDVTKSLIAEFLFTFALAYVVLNVATAKGTSGNSFYGLAIGFVVMAGAFSVGGISGGAFNPAVAIAAPLMGLMDWNNIWIHISADFAGGALAAIVFNMLNGDDQ